jgi:uncharacterized repeat protein (TIGR01451 family)
MALLMAGLLVLGVARPTSAAPLGNAGPSTYTNSSAITINDNAAASPYPSTINVSGFTGTTSRVTVTLNGLSHTWIQDVDVIVVGPGGQKAWVLSDVGGFSGGVSNVTLTLDDNAASSLPAGAFGSGTYKPTNNSDSIGDDIMPSPAPSGPYDGSFANFGGIDPNGTWQLFARDDASEDSGSIAGGWTLTVYPATAPAATKLAVSGFNNPAVAGAPYNLTVTAQDASNNTITGYTGTVHFTSSDPNAVLPSDYTFVAGDNGVHIFSGVTILKTAGLQSITATDTVTGSITGSQTNIQVVANYPANLAVSGGDNQSAALGTGFAQPLEVTVTDNYGNPAPNAQVTFSAPGSGASAALSSPAPTGSNGKTSVTATANNITGSYQVTASLMAPDHARPSGTPITPVFHLTNVQGLPVNLEIVSGTPQSALVGQPFAQPLVVKVSDINHNPISGVAVLFKAPGSGASAALSSPALTGADGKTQVMATANGLPGSYQVTASLDLRATAPSFANPGVQFNLTNYANPESADLAVKLAADNTHPSPGQVVTFKATVTNQGPNNASGAQVSFKFSKGLNYTGVVAPSGTSYNPATGVWTIDNLENGASISLTLTAEVTATGQFSLVATLAGGEPLDPNAENNTAMLVLNSEPPKVPAEVAAQLMVTPDRVLPAAEGSKLVMHFTLRNIGPGRARYLVARVPFDPILQPVGSNFPNNSDWITKIVAEGEHPYLEIHFHDLEMYQQATGSVTFQVKAGATPGAMMNLRFTGYWDDDTAVSRSRESNLVQVTFGSADQNDNDAKVRHFNPAQVTVNRGAHVKLAADYFSPEEKVEFWYTGADGKSVSLGYVWADKQGNVSFEFGTANLPAGVYSISGSGYFSRAQGTSVLTVKDGTQNLTPRQANLKVGQSVKLAGNCFAPGEKVDYWYTGPDGKSVSLGYAWANDKGEVSLSFDATGRTPGEYTVVARGNQTGISAQAVIKVVAA